VISNFSISGSCAISRLFFLASGMPTSLRFVASDWLWLDFYFFISNILRNQNADGLSTPQ